jgi:hypothetical protein
LITSFEASLGVDGKGFDVGERIEMSRDLKRRFVVTLLMWLMALWAWGSWDNLYNPGSKAWAQSRGIAVNQAPMAVNNEIRNSKLSRLLNKVKLFCNNTTTRADGSSDNYFILMLTVNLAGLFTAIYIFFGASMTSAIRKGTRGFIRMSITVASRMRLLFAFSKCRSKALLLRKGGQ